MVFGTILFFLAIIGLITILRPFIFKKTRIPLDKIKIELKRRGLTMENYKIVEKGDISDINFKEDSNPFNTSLFYGIGCYEINAKNKDGGITTLYVKWYQSHGFPFKDNIYLNLKK